MSDINGLLNGSMFSIEFGGHDVRAMFHGQRFVANARDIGRALGYSDDGKRLVTNITREWAGEFRNGTEATMISGTSGVAGSATLNNRGELYLTKEGIILATMLSKKEAGQRLRRWFLDVAWPILEKVAAGQPVTADERRVLGVGAGVVFGIHPDDMPAIEAAEPSQERRRLVDETDSVTRLREFRLWYKVARSRATDPRMVDRLFMEAFEDLVGVERGKLSVYSPPKQAEMPLPAGPPAQHVSPQLPVAPKFNDMLDQYLAHIADGTMAIDPSDPFLRASDVARMINMRAGMSGARAVGQYARRLGYCTGDGVQGYSRNNTFAGAPHWHYSLQAAKAIRAEARKMGLYIIPGGQAKKDVADG